MAAATLGATYSPPSPFELQYGDATSILHPDRPIRPLPKRRLRSKLSADVADSILYPAETVHSSKPLFQFPYDDHASPTNRLPTPGDNFVREIDAPDSSDDTEKDRYKFTGNDFGSDEEVFVARRHQEPRPKLGTINAVPLRNGHSLTKSEAIKFIKPSIPRSLASSNESVDGYDSFENTNNKKKRKIPTSGSLGGHQSSLSADLAHMALSPTHDIDVGTAETDSGVAHYYGSGSSAVPAVSSGNGISGAGRGRYGRVGTRHHSGRSPLGVSINGSNTLQANRSLYYRRDQGLQDSPGVKELGPAPPSDRGIISAAIANAAALPVTPMRGQENASLFEHQSSAKPSSAKTQFTFTCESDSAKSMVWPDESPSSRFEKDVSQESRSRSAQNARGFATQGTQTSPNIAGQSGQDPSQPSAANQQARQQPRKPRRPLAKQYALAAQERSIRQKYKNYQHPPKDEDIWICQFCEYESIFGQQPQNLIRQYEAKDRRERKRQAEKRRLLEKAKMKGRKNKKGNKNAAKNPNTMNQSQQQNQKQRYDQQQNDDLSSQNQGMQSDEYVLDGYEEDPVPVPIPGPAQTPSKIPKPIAQTHNHSVRPPSGSAAMRQENGAGQDAYF